MEVKCWSTFEELLNDENGRKQFHEFVKKEHSEENVQFWLKCKEFKHIDQKNQKALREKGAEIIGMFDYMNLVSATKKEAKLACGKELLTSDIFEIAQNEIKELMEIGKRQLCMKGELNYCSINDQFINLFISRFLMDMKKNLSKK